MKKAIAWEIAADGRPRRLATSQVDLERQLEDWIVADIGIVADDVLVIGRQIITPSGTRLDLLGIDAAGNLVIVELKRDQTLRETVAQSIEYAAWADKLDAAQVLQYGNERFGSDKAFRTEFQRLFGSPLPDTLNVGQRILLVAP